GPQARGRDRLPGGRGPANVGPFAGALPARVAAKLIYVASPASRARVSWAQSSGAGSPRLRRLSPDPPGTWERHVEAVERFRGGIGLDRVVLVVHDTGGAVGLPWACDHP